MTDGRLPDAALPILLTRVARGNRVAAADVESLLREVVASRQLAAKVREAHNWLIASDVWEEADMHGEGYQVDGWHCGLCRRRWEGERAHPDGDCWLARSGGAA